MRPYFHGNPMFWRKHFPPKLVGKSFSLSSTTTNYSHFGFILFQIDHSIVESFGGEGRSCITARVYPELAINKEAHLYVFNNGTQSVKISRLDAWSMRKAEIVPTNRRRNSHFN